MAKTILELMMLDAEQCNARLNIRQSDMKTRQRRRRVAEQLDKGYTGKKVAEILGEVYSVVCNDIQAIRRERKKAS